MYLFTFLPTVEEYSLFSTSVPAFIVCRFFDVGNPDRCEVITYCSFDLHFSINEHLLIFINYKEWRRQWHPTPILLPGKSHGWRSLVVCSPWGCQESDMTERLHFDFSLSCIGEGNANPLQYSCLENPRDGGAWWAAVYGVAQSRTWLRRLSGGSSGSYKERTLYLFGEICVEVFHPFFF